MQTRTELEALIAGIRQQIERSESSIEDLQESRQAALLAGDSARLDEIEVAVEQHRKENGRREERIGLLEAELVTVDKRDQTAYVAGVRERGLRAAQLGEEIIRKEYAPAARKIGAAIEKLAVLRAEITEANWTLNRDGGEPVPDFDANRHVPGWYPPPTVEVIEIKATDPRHSLHQQYRDTSSSTYDGTTLHELVERMGVERIEVTKEARWEPGTNAVSLEDHVNLPGVIGSDLYFWRGEHWRHGHQALTPERHQELSKALLGDEPPALAELAERAPSIRQRLSSVVEAIARPLRNAGRM